MLGGSVGNEGCLHAVQCQAPGTEYFMKASKVDSRFIPVNNTVSSIRNRVGFKLKSELTYYYHLVKLRL